jgi:hypothetical protein
MELANQIYNYERIRAADVNSNDKLEVIKESVFATLKLENMAPLYSQLCQKFSWSLDENVLAIMK